MRPNETENPQTLGDALPLEMARCRQILLDAKSIGPSGAFLVAMITQDLSSAEKAMIAGDVVGMLRAFKSLKEYSS